MSQTKFTKTLLAVSIAGLCLPYALATPLELKDGDSYTNTDQLDDYVNIIGKNTKLTNNAYISGAVYFETPDFNSTIINNGFNNNINNVFELNKQPATLDITNNGFIKSIESSFLNANGVEGGNLSIKNLGKVKVKNFVTGDLNKAKPVQNFGLLLTDDTGNHATFKFANYGVLKTTALNVAHPDYENYGIEIVNNQIKVGTGGTYNINGTNMTIVNGTQAGDGDAQPPIFGSILRNDFNENIINAQKFLVLIEINKPNYEVSFRNSIVNAGLEIRAQESASVTFNNSIYNGSYDDDLTIDVHGDERCANSTTNLNFKGKSVINADLVYNTVAGNNVTNNLNLDNTVLLNGNLDGGKKTTNNFNIKQAGGNLNIYNDVKNFNNMNVAGNTTIFSTATFENVSVIDIQKGANLTVKIEINSPDNNMISAFENNTGTIKSSGGKLVIDAKPSNRLEQGVKFDFGDTSLDPSLFGKDEEGNPIGTLSDNIISAHHLVDLDVDFDPVTGGDKITSIKLSLKKRLATNDMYNDIYQAILDSGNVADLANTTDAEQIYWTLEQLYSANPYGYTMKSALNSLKLFQDTGYSTIQPKQAENLFSVKAIYTGDRVDNYASGNGFYTERKLKTSTNTVGLLLTNEYGLTDNRSVGVGLGYSNQQVKFKGLSNIKGNNLFLGVFMKNNFGNFKTKVGFDYQYTKAKVDHNIVNTQDSFTNSANVSNNALSLYGEGKYNFDITQNFSIAPVASLAYNYVSQGDVNEGQGRLASNVQSSNLSLFDIGAGVDFGYKINTYKGVLSQILHIGAIGTFGNNQKTLTASFIGKSNQYNFKAVTIPKVMGKFGYKIEFEATNRFVYNLGGNYEVGKDTQDFSAQIGLGYKF